MDDTLIAVYRDMLSRRRCSADDILADPDLRTEFVSHSRTHLGSDVQERDLLRRLTNLRKRSKLPRSKDV